MPAKDRLHDTVVRALVKDGWTIVKEQVTLIIDKRWVFIDIRALKAEQSLGVLVEVKGFEDSSQVDYLADTV